MRRFGALAVVLAFMVAGSIGLLGQRPVVAQEATEIAMADHPVVGAWQWLNNPADPTNVSFSIFHADGTYAETNALGDVAIGVWRPTGERTADLTVVHQDVSFVPLDPDVFEPGTLIGRAAVEVDLAGTAISAPMTVYLWSSDEAFQYAAGPYETIALRMDVDPLAPFGAPVAGTPTP
jgi:hypothetical protein